MPTSLPPWMAGAAIIVGLGLFAVTGVWVVRRFALPRMRVHVHDSEFTGAIVQAIMVFYGLALALVAVNVWETNSEARQRASTEAAAIATVYRDVRGYPEPLRTELQSSLERYSRYIVEEAWPAQRRGEIPSGGVALLDAFEARLMSYEPRSSGQTLLHAETLGSYDRLIEARRLRLDAVTSQLPGVLTFVIVAGAFISLSAAFFFKVEDGRLHAIQMLLLATFIGLVLFMTFALDRPFQGQLAVPADAYQLVIDQLMGRG